MTYRAYQGATDQSLTEGTAAQYHYDVKAVAFIMYVEAGSAAEQAGLKMGDVITKVDDTEIKTIEDLNLAKKKYSAGDTATLEVYRLDGTITVEITWGAAPAEEQAEEETPQRNQGNQYYGNDYYSGGYDPFDMFRYFFG